MRHSLFATEDGTGFRVLLEQASHEIHKGAYDIGLHYLNKALSVINTFSNELARFLAFVFHFLSWSCVIPIVVEKLQLLFHNSPEH